MTPAEELEAAAALLDALVADVTPGPWTCPRRIAVRAPVPDDERGWLLTDNDGLVLVVQAPAFEGTRELLRKRSPADLSWIVALGPQVAPHLSAWLRAEAATSRSHEATRAASGRDWRDDHDPDDPPHRWTDTATREASESAHRHALAFARALLGAAP